MSAKNELAGLSMSSSLLFYPSLFVFSSGDSDRDYTQRAGRRSSPVLELEIKVEIASERDKFGFPPESEVDMLK
jgi:hypothetical protein